MSDTGHRKIAPLGQPLLVDLVLLDRSDDPHHQSSVCMFCGTGRRERVLVSTTVWADHMEMAIRFCLDCLMEVAGAELREVIAR